MEGPGIPLYREESKGEGRRGPLSGLSPGLGTTDHSSGPTTSWWNLASFASPLQTLCSSQTRLQTAPTGTTDFFEIPHPLPRLLLSSPSHSAYTTHCGEFPLLRPWVPHARPPPCPVPRAALLPRRLWLRREPEPSAELSPLLQSWRRPPLALLKPGEGNTARSLFPGDHSLLFIYAFTERFSY